MKLIKVIALIIVGIIVAGVVLGTGCAEYEEGLSEVTGYDILRDTVLIVLTAIAVITAIVGAALFFALRASLAPDIVRRANERVDTECRRLLALVDVRSGITYWIAHMYDHAIHVTQRALRDASDILPEQEVISAKSNLGFYYAEKHRQKALWHFKKEAIALTELGYAKYNPTIADFNKPDWVDNYVFTRATFTKTRDEQREVIALIDNLLTRDDLESVRQFLQESKQYASGVQPTGSNH